MAITSLRETDRISFSELESFVESTLSRSPVGPLNPPGARERFGIRSYVSWLNNYTRELQRAGKGVSFILSNTTLAMLNPTLGMGQLYNPLSITGPPPLAGGFTTNKLDVPSAADNPGTRISKNQDRLRRLYEGNFVDADNPREAQRAIVDGPQKRDSQGRTFADLRRDLSQGFERSQEDYGRTVQFDQESSNPASFEGTTPIQNAAGVSVQKFAPESFFVKKPIGPGFMSSPGGYNFYEPIPGARVEPSADYRNKQAALLHDENYYSPDDQILGFINTDDNPISEEFTYVPFFFQDLRKPERRIYFPAFLESITEDFTANWNRDVYYGRTDPVGTYQNTERSFNITFIIASMSPQSLHTMWKKISNFIKLLYPTKSGGLLKSGPMIRCRIGDLFATDTGAGLPGWIDTANFDYNQFPWETGPSNTSGELQTGKVPQMCRLSFKFQVIHGADLHLDADYNMDVGAMRKMGSGERQEPATTDEQAANQRANNELLSTLLDDSQGQGINNG